MATVIFSGRDIEIVLWILVVFASIIVVLMWFFPYQTFDLVFEIRLRAGAFDPVVTKEYLALQGESRSLGHLLSKIYDRQDQVQALLCIATPEGADESAGLIDTEQLRAERDALKDVGSRAFRLHLQMKGHLTSLRSALILGIEVSSDPNHATEVLLEEAEVIQHSFNKRMDDIVHLQSAQQELRELEQKSRS